MPRVFAAALSLLVLAACASAPLKAEPAVPHSREQIALSFAPVVRDAAPAVVNIVTRTRRAPSPLDEFFGDPLFRRFFGDRQGPGRQPRAETSLGSGVLLRRDGLVVTNHHVIEDADEIMVVLSDRREFEAGVVGADPPSDLALLQIDPAGADLPVLSLGDSDRLEVGDLVLAIGNPFGIGQTVTSGIVSALSRTSPGLERDLTFIQTDAAINPGNSGGALITLDGRLIGINTAIFTRSGGSIGIGFAIPINLVKALVRSIEDGEGRLNRPWLGARLQPVDAELAAGLGLPRPAGVLVRQLHPDGPAARAGLAQGDVILAIDGMAVFDETGLNFRLAVGGRGEESELEVWRRGRTLRFEVPLEAPPYLPPPDVTRLEGRHPLSGATVGNLSPGFNRDLGLDLAARGVVVLKVEARSPAARLRLRRGDIVATLDGTRIEDVGALQEALARLPLPWRLEIERGERRLAVVITG